MSTRDPLAFAAHPLVEDLQRHDVSDCSRGASRAAVRMRRHRLNVGHMRNARRSM